MLQELLPPFVWLVELAIVTLTLAGAWGTFERAGQRGWAVLVPFYNLVVLARAAHRRQLAIWLLVPFVNLFVLVPVSISLARRFGKGAAFGLGLVLAPFVFYPLLGLRSGQAVEKGARERKPDAKRTGPPPPPLVPAPAPSPELAASPPPLPPPSPELAASPLPLPSPPPELAASPPPLPPPLPAADIPPPLPVIEEPRTIVIESKIGRPLPPPEGA